MVKKYKCIIFDLDGTILNTQRMNLLPLQRLIKEEKGIDLDYDSLIKYTCYPGKKTLGLLEFEDIETSYDKWVKYVNEFEEIATIYDGFNEVIKTLHEKGIICGIASSKMKKQYEIDFIPTGLDKYMQSVVLEEDTKNHKPHPEPLLKAIELFNVSPDECMYIGDTIVDYKSSKSAGMDFGLAVWGA
ncbi:MAG: HAD family hydrolase, partial [Peptostreptococcaceae bacterium]